MSGCCLEPGCRRRHPIGLYAGDFSGQVFAVTRRRTVKENDDGTATYAATERHDVTEQMRRFIQENKAWVRLQLVTPAVPAPAVETQEGDRE